MAREDFATWPGWMKEAAIFEGMCSVEQKRIVGRPLLGDEPKRASFNTRLRPKVRDSLQVAADRNGRSLSEEVEWRLEMTLMLEGML